MAKVGDAGVVGKNGVGEGPVHVVLLVSVVPLDGVQADLAVYIYRCQADGRIGCVEGQIQGR
jgi:hypothetical protein